MILIHLYHQISFSFPIFYMNKNKNATKFKQNSQNHEKRRWIFLDKFDGYYIIGRKMRKKKEVYYGRRNYTRRKR